MHNSSYPQCSAKSPRRVCQAARASLTPEPAGTGVTWRSCRSFERTPDNWSAGPASNLSHKCSHFFPSMRLFGRQPDGRPLSRLSTSLPPLSLTNGHEWYPQLPSPFQHMESAPLKGYRGAHGRRARGLKPSQLGGVFFGPRPGYSSQIVLRAKETLATGMAAGALGDASRG
jgi:hypothetical protein